MPFDCVRIRKIENEVLFHSISRLTSKLDRKPSGGISAPSEIGDVFPKKKLFEKKFRALQKEHEPKRVPGPYAHQINNFVANQSLQTSTEHQMKLLKNGLQVWQGRADISLLIANTNAGINP